MKLGRKFWLGLLGTVGIAVVTYAGGQIPLMAPLVPWAISAIAALTGITASAIAYEDSQHARARADVESAGMYAAAAESTTGGGQ